MPRTRRLLRGLGGRRAVAMADQAVSSSSNFLVTLLVARVLDTEAFGAFSVALIAYQLATGGVRATVGEPFLSAHSTDSGRDRDRAMGDLLYASFAVSAVAAVVMVAGALVVGGPTAAPLVAMALAFPFLGMQDSLRHVAVVDRPHLALVSDVGWLVVVAGMLALAPAGASPAWFVAAWGVSGVVGLMLALVSLRAPLRTGNARRWLRDHREMAGAFLAETVAARTTSYVIVLLLGPIAGLSAIGAVRAGQVFYGPLNTLFSGIYLALVPDGARQRDSPRRLLRFMAVASGVVSLAATVWLLVGVFLPDSAGEALFGDTWARAEEVLLPLGFAMICGSAATGAFAGIRSLGNARASLRARLTSLPPEILLTLVGAMMGGAVGYSIGYAAACAVIAVIWWSAFLLAIRQEERAQDRPSVT